MKLALAAAAAVLALAGCADTTQTPVGAEASLDPSAAAAEAKRLAENEAALREAAVAEASASAAAAAAAAAPPKAEDFNIAVVVLEKQCFGSAGCNVTFRIDPSYTGSGSATDVEVTFEVLGGDDAYIDTFTIDSEGTATFTSEATVGTPSANAELTAKVTAVRRA